MATRILFYGATGMLSICQNWTRFNTLWFIGFIGGSILARLLKHPKRESFEITAVIRSASKADKFKSFGIDTVIGSLDDYDFLGRISSEAEIIIQTVRQTLHCLAFQFFLTV